MKTPQFSPRQRLGLAGEQWAARQLQALGHTAQPVADWLADVDLIIDSILPCEVKLARPRWQYVRAGYRRLRWQFDVARLPVGVDSLVILICETADGEHYPYLVPSWLLWDRKTIQITSHPRKYQGRLAGYLNAWSNVELVLNERRRRAGQQSGQLALPIFASVGGAA